MSEAVRSLRISFQPEWDPGKGGPSGRGLFARDPRVRTLLKVLVSYSEVRYVVADRISLDGSTSMSLLESIGRFLGRQSWLVRGVEIA